MPRIPNNPTFNAAGFNIPHPRQCQVCIDIRPSGPDTATCKRCGRTSHYMNFIQDLRHILIRYEGHELPSGASHAHVDLGPIPADIQEIKERLDKLDELEKALSVFSEVLKSAIQT